MTDNYFFLLARMLRFYYKYDDIQEIVSDYASNPLKEQVAAPEPPRSVLKSLLLEDGKKTFHIHGSMIISGIVFLLTIIVVMTMRVSGNCFGLKYALVVAVLSAALWYAVRGNTIAGFSWLNPDYNRYTMPIILLNVLCVLIPTLALIISNRLLLAGNSISDPMAIGRALSISLKIIEAVFALVFIGSLILSIRTSILFFTVSVSSIGVCYFCVCFETAMSLLATPKDAAALLFEATMPSICGILAALSFAILIKHLIDRGKKNELAA